MRSDVAARVVIVASLVLTLHLMFRIFRPFLPAIAWAIVLVVVFEPFYVRVARLLGGRERLAALVLSGLVAVFIVVPAVVVVVKVARGLADAYAWLEPRLTSGRPIESWFAAPAWLADMLSWIRERFDLEALDLRAMSLAAVRTAGGATAGGVRAIVTNAVETILFVVVLVATMTVLFPGGPRLLETVRRYLPLSEKDKEEAFALLRDTTRAVFFGVMLTAFVQGVLGAIGFAIVGLPNAVMFGAAMFLCALLPGGTAIVWAPAAVWLFVSGHPVKAVVLAVWGALAVSSVDNVLRPIFIGRGVKLSMLLVFFGTLGGVLAFGLIGLFTGPLVITLFLFLLEVARRDFFRPPESADPAGSTAAG